MKQKYLLDTNICISLLKNKYGVREAIVKAKAENCFISEVTIAELYYGASKSGNREARIKDVEFIAKMFMVLPIFPSLQVYGDLKARLELSGNRIDDFDILIGATAICNGLIMVTDNLKHLGRLDGIQLENWTNRE